MVRATKSPLLLSGAAWAVGGLLLGLSIPSTAYTTGSMNTSSSISDTRTTSARYTSTSTIVSSSSSGVSGNTTSSSIVDTKTTSARYTSEFIPEEEESSFSGLTSSEGLCVASNTGCLGDADCSKCLTRSSRQGNSGTPCQSRYPDHFNSSSTICQQVAAIYCCYYEDESTAEGCLDNFHTAQYWNCIVTGLGLNCLVEDMPCYGGVLTETSSPTGVPIVTASPSAVGYSEVPTSSPTITPDGRGSGRTAPPTQAPSSTPSDGPTMSPTNEEPDDITGDLDGASRLAAGALAPWRLVLFSWGLGIWLSNTLVNARR